MKRHEFLRELREFNNDHIVSYDENRRSMDNDSYFELTCCGCGDYAGSLVNKANHTAILDHDGDMTLLAPKTMSYGYDTIVIYISDIYACKDKKMMDNIIESLNSLVDYPCLDDSELFRIEEEEKDKSWDESMCSEYAEELQKKYPQFEDLEYNNSNLRSLFEETADTIGEYWQNEKDYMWINVEKVVENTIMPVYQEIFYAADESTELDCDCDSIQDLRDGIEYLEKAPFYSTTLENMIDLMTKELQVKEQQLINKG